MLVHDEPLQRDDGSMDTDGDGIDDDAERRSYRVT